ncbi:MAG: serine hydrolase domain-containing protein [Saprospiraceae bacterium]|nr:serine hydrolase domain-containing protein [Saprospiraceae bacterium]MDZ4703107.1 serine hydrolase domain-containing protein [Saprospiraceae bacterium]
MKPIQVFLYFTLSCCLSACGVNKPNSSSDMSPNAPTSTYKALEFTDAGRLDKIKKSIPEVEKIFREFAETNHYPGYAYGIVVDGKLIHARSDGVINVNSRQPATTASLFRIASMTKSFTAMAILKLRDEGKLSLHDPVLQYLPQLAPLNTLTSDAPPPTLHNLMTMTAGFPEDNPWGDRQLEDTDEEFLEFLRGGISFSTVSSSTFEYSNMGYAMLGRIITQVSGMPYQKYITENIFKPLGMKDTHWEYEGLPAERLALGYRWEAEQWKLEPMLHDGAYGAMGGMITSIEDFSKYVAFLLSAWPAKNGSETGPVKRSSVREMCQIVAPRLIPNAKDTDGNPCAAMAGYGYGLGVRKDCQGLTSIGHSGGLPGFGSNHSFFPDYGIGIISFVNLTYAPASAANVRALRLLVQQAGLQPRQLPVSDILAKRKEQVVQLLQTWDSKLGDEILAENFYPDFSREYRMKEYEQLLAQSGKIVSVEPIVPENQLRGTFILNGEKKAISVFFTLSPERIPKVQALEVSLVED